MFCTKCGNEQQPGYKFCEACGTQFGPGEAVHAQQETPPPVVKPRNDVKVRYSWVLKALKASGNHGQFSHSREIEEFAWVLDDGEIPIAIATGRSGKSIVAMFVSPESQKYNVVAMATDQRVILVDWGEFAPKSKSLNLGQISTFNYQTGIFKGSITFRTSSGETVIRNIPNTMVKHFAQEMARVEVVKERRRWRWYWWTG